MQVPEFYSNSWLQSPELTLQLRLTGVKFFRTPSNLPILTTLTAIFSQFRDCEAAFEPAALTTLKK
jgi:hypothetical protein